MAAEDDIDRAAILARRQRFISMTLVGLASGCRPATPADEPLAPAELAPHCKRIADELAAVPELPEFDPDAPDEHTRAYYSLAHEAVREECFALALQAHRHGNRPHHASLVYEIALSAYQAGDHTSAREALTYLLEHAHALRVPARDRRYARRLLQDLEAGLAWEESRPHPRPQPCLSRSPD